jgi:hypothetical protein
MADGYGAGAIQLLGQHRPRQQVRPGERPERKCCVRPRQHPRIQALGTADDEADCFAGFQPAVEQRGKGFAGRCRTAEVEGDDKGAGRNGGQQRIGLSPLDLGRAASAFTYFGEGQS